MHEPSVPSNDPFDGIDLLIADEYPIVRRGIRTVLANAPDIRIVAETDTVPGLVESARTHLPHIVLLDLCLSRHRVAEGIRTIRETVPQTRFLIYTQFGGTDEVAMAMRANIEGYLLKTDDSDLLVTAIRAIHTGKRWISPALTLLTGSPLALPSLTEREQMVLATIASGKSNQEVADILFIAEGTVKFHVNNILSKLGVGDRTEAVIVGLQRGLLRLPEK